MNVIKIIPLLLFITVPVTCQVLDSNKPIYIIFDGPRDNVIQKVSVQEENSEKKYPIDVTRAYFMKSFRFCNTCDKPSWDLGEFMFVFDPKVSSYTYVTSMDIYKDGNVLDQAWFDKTPLDEIFELFNRRNNVYLIDKGYLVEGKRVLLKVTYNKRIVH